ncbi:MAG: pyridoxamine 5'-phosphate oxidase family protein [Ornithinimicrobium sp.]
MDEDPSATGGETEHLSVSQCWEALRGARFGRVAIDHDGAPDIFPVNHIVDHGSVVYRTSAGALFTATVHHDVAFEVDGFDADTSTAWSVVVRGRASERQQMDEVLQTLSLPVTPWQPGAKPRFVRIEPTEVSGRRFRVESADADPDADAAPSPTSSTASTAQSGPSAP